MWSRGALTAAWSPKLGARPSNLTFSFNEGATNPRSRWLLTGSYKVADQFAPQLLLYGGADTPTQVGINLSGVISDAAVAFAEVSAGKGRSLAAQALARADRETDQQRAAFGLTYTTGFNLSLTAEAEFNSAAPDRAEWDALATIDPAAPLLTLARAQRLQDLPTRRALFVHALWKDAFVPRLDLSAFVRHDSETSSRAQWLEVRYRFSRADLALQWLVYSGDPGSIFGTIPQRRAIDLSLRWYL